MLLSWSSWEPSDNNVTHDEDEDPGKLLQNICSLHGDVTYDEIIDEVIGIDPSSEYALDVAQRRDPDALPPTNVVEVIGSIIHDALQGLTRGNVQFALKGGLFAGKHLMKKWMVVCFTNHRVLLLSSGQLARFPLEYCAVRRQCVVLIS